MTDHATAQAHARTSRQSLFVMRRRWWAVFALICLSAAGFRCWQDAALRRAMKQYEIRYQAFDKAAGASIRDTASMLSKLSGQRPRPTREAVEARLNDGQPFKTRQKGNVMIAEYEVPVAGMICELRFTDGRFSDFGFTGEIQWLAWQAPSGWHVVYRIHRTIRRRGVVAWWIVAVIAVGLVVRTRRRPSLPAALAVDVQLMIAISVLLNGASRSSLILIGGKATGGWRPEVSIIHVVMLCVGLGLLLLYRLRAKEIDPGLCQVCEYNLTGNVSGICPECGTPIPITNATET